MRADYRVTVKVRNNNILAASEEMGLSLPQLAEKAGISYSLLVTLVNMTTSPFGRYGTVRWQVDALCATVGKSFDELFSAEQCTALETNKSEAAMNAEQVFALVNRTADVASIEHDDGLTSAVSKVVGTLTEREQQVIDRRFGFTDEAATLAQIGEELGITTERVRQIEAKALRKLRHPQRADDLRAFMGIEA